MAVSATQRHNPADSINERTSGRRIDAFQQFVALRITETANTDAQGKFTLTHAPIGSLARQFDNLSRINEKPDLVALTAADAPLYPGVFDLDSRKLSLYIDAGKATPAANLVGAKVSYWYYAPIKGTLNDDGTFTPDVKLASNSIPDAQAVPTKITGRLLAIAQIGEDQAATFANSAAQNTQVNVDIVKPASPSQRHQIAFYNPSVITDLTVKIFGKELTLGGGTRYVYYDTITVPKSQAITGTTVEAYVKEIEGIFAGTDLRLVVSNDTPLGAADGFSAYIRVKAV